jgi:hypothetical protein
VPAKKITDPEKRKFMVGTRMTRSIRAALEQMAAERGLSFCRYLEEIANSAVAARKNAPS